MKKKKDVLERIISAKRREVEFHKANMPEEALLDSTAARAPKRSMREALLKASPYGIMAEFKRKSQSGGFINRDSDDPEKCDYAARVRWIKTTDKSNAKKVNGKWAYRPTCVNIGDKKELLELLEKAFDIKFDELAK